LGADTGIFDGGKHIVKHDLKEYLTIHNQQLRKFKHVSEKNIDYYSDIAIRSYYENKAWVKQILDALRGRFNIIVVRDYTNTPIPSYDADIGEW